MAYGNRNDYHIFDIINLEFLKDGLSYNALVFSDDARDVMKREVKVVGKKDKLSIDMLERGGFAIRLSPGTQFPAMQQSE